MLLFSAACGGDSSSSSVKVEQNPVPDLIAIFPTSAPAGSRDFVLTVSGYNFLSGSVVQWGGSSRTTTFVSSSQLTAAIPAGDVSSVRTVSVTVLNPAPGGGSSGAKSFSITPVLPLTLLTSSLPDASPSRAYQYSLRAEGGVPPYTWSVTSGSLPDNLSFSTGGVISGTPSAVSADTNFSFAAQLKDYAYQPNTLTQPFTILVRAGKLGRNDSCGTATPILNGVIRASLSPYGDIDVYSFQGIAGASVTAEIYAQRLTIYEGSNTRDIFLDSFLEILDSDCQTLISHDDINPGVDQDSVISSYKLPYTGKYYIRVSDLRGDGRPDFIYELHLSGAKQ